MSTVVVEPSSSIVLLSSSLSGESESSRSEVGGKVRFRGKGRHALLRPGVVLLAPTHEYGHFLLRSAIFLFVVRAVDEFGERVTRGVILDHPTAFTVGEMSGSVTGELGDNTLFQGGDSGNDCILLLHRHGHTDNDSSPVFRGREIGTSGIYEGGLEAATMAADRKRTDPRDYKFFFNFVQFSDLELQHMLSVVVPTNQSQTMEEEEETDAWISVEVSEDVILRNDYGRGDAWSYLRNRVKMLQNRQQQS